MDNICRSATVNRMSMEVSRSVTGSRFYRPELDVLRFGAFLLVFLRHIAVPKQYPMLAAICSSGRAGVCVFFLLSAFLITELLEREASATHRIDLRAFYLRRILRVWPLYFAALLLARLIDWHAPHLQMSNERLIASVLLAGNWYTYFHGFPFSFAIVLWSISVEEQFYLLWPSIRRFLGSTALLWASILTFPVSYATLVWLALSGHLDLQMWVNTFVQLQFFGAGALLALQLRRSVPEFRHTIRLSMLMAGVCTLIVGQCFVHDRSELPGAPTVVLEYSMMLAASLLIFLSAYNFAPLRKAKGLIYLGKISYGLYVFQNLGLRVALRPANWLARHTRVSADLFDGFRDVLGLAVTIMLAALSYRFFEAPFLRLKERFVIIRTRSV